MSKHNFWLFGATAAVLACIVLSGCGRDEAAGDDGTKIALIAAAPSHGEGHHDWDQDARFIKQCLEEAPNVEDLTIEIHSNGWPRNPRDLDSADAIVFLTDGARFHPLKEPGRVAMIDKLAKKGKGLMFVHYAVDPPEGAGAKFTEWMGGCYEPGYSQNPINTVPVSLVENDHPVSRGCGGYEVEDEWYFDIRFPKDGPPVTPIMTGMLPREPEPKVLAWAAEREDGGRGFGFTGGHYHQNWRAEPFRKLVLNAILWTARVEVPAGGVASGKTWRFVSIPDFVNVDLTYPQPGWEDTLDYVLKAIKAEDPEFVLVAGDLVMGRWPDKDSIKKHAAIYYPAWTKRMQDHGLKYYTAIGDHEIGDNPWRDETKAALVPYFKRQFQRYLKMPLNGPLRMRGTAFYFVHENTLFISVDPFEKGEGPQGGIVPKVTGEQLEWFDKTIATHSGVKNVVIMGHTPILGPVKKESSSGLMLEGGAESPLWQAMKKYGVDLYLCGEVHAITCTRADDVLQIAHGGLFGYNPKVNYLLGTVSGDQIKLELKEIEIINSGDKLEQVGNNRPQETVTIADDVRQGGFVTVGTVTLNKAGTVKTLTSATGCFTPATVQ